MIIGRTRRALQRVYKHLPAPSISISSAIVAALILTSVFAAPLAGKVMMQQASATFPGVNGRIAFVSERDGRTNIYTMNPDGSSVLQLTKNAGSNYGENWSPDGSKIVFNSDRDGGQEIYVMNADGTGQTRLTNITGGSLSMPTWSPDGSKIAFNFWPGGFQHIYVMNADGSSIKDLTGDISNSHSLFPDWSPDGSKIVFTKISTLDVGNPTTVGTLMLMNADGTGKSVLMNLTGAAAAVPSWSPDGTKIAFETLGDEANATMHIYTINPDGTHLTKLTDNRMPGGSGFFFNHDLYPSWSPDGKQITFTSNRDGNDEIYVMNADGTGQTNINHNPASDNGGRWGVHPVIPPSPQHVDLTVNTVDLSGKPVAGVWTTVRGLDGTLIKTGFTPFIFIGDSGTSYKVTMANYDGKVFQHWNDTTTAAAIGGASTSNIRTIDLTANTTLTAVYDTGNSLRGFTPLTFTDTSHHISLTVNALSLANNQTLHMSMIIDPQSTNATGTTYKVYATDGYQNFRFDHWLDNGSTDRFRTITINENTTLTAYYKSESVNANGKIAFSSNRDGNFEIYTMNPDGSGQTRLTFISSANNTNPVWSPDGTKIAFVSTDKATGKGQIHVMNGADGSGQVNVSNNSTADDSSPAWSPDGSKIAFVRDGEITQRYIVANGEIIVMNAADGSGKTKVGTGYYPFWSPDGTKIAFVFGTVQNGSYAIYAANPDGSGGQPTQILSSLFNGCDTCTFLKPAWSPDGSKIVFELGLPTSRPPLTHIVIANANGTGAHEIGLSMQDSDPAWSPSSSQLAFSRVIQVGPTQFEGGIHILNISDNAVTKLTDSIGDNSPRWSPDGNKLAFAREGEIFAMNANGTGLLGLTNNNNSTITDTNPDWGR